MMKELGYAISAIYALGIVAVQAHLLRFGILDISAIDVYYLFVGTWVLVCILPSVAILLVLDIGLARAMYKYSRVTVISLIIGIFMASAFMLARFAYHQLIFNFNAYPYLKWRFVVSNILGVNVALLIIWSLLVMARKRGGSLDITRKALVCAGTLAVLTFAVFFGRSIYPALDRGMGGGAPQFARLDTDCENAVPVLLVHAGEDFIYFLELDEFPFKRSTERDSSTQYTDRSGPVYRALVKNEVVKLPTAIVRRITVIGFNQRRNIEKYR